MSENNLNRRDFLKVLIASGAGLTASSLVPSKWMKPLVNTGVMPVHAQTSLTYYLDGGSDGFATRDFEIVTVPGVWAFVASAPIIFVHNGAHAKLAAPAKFNDTGVPNWPVTVTVLNLDLNNIASLTGLHKKFTNTDSPIGMAEFGDIEVTLSKPDGETYDFNLVFSAPNCQDVLKQFNSAAG